MRNTLSLILLLAAALGARAQCDSTPPRLEAAFTMFGDTADEHFGQWMYVIHDTSGRAQLAISSSGQQYAMRVYSKYAGELDTAYRCCLPYTEVHECHVTGSSYTDYVAHQFIAGHNDSIFLIPGTPEGIWSVKRQLLMTPAYDANIVTGRFDGSDRDMVAIGNLRTKSMVGSVSIWHGKDSLSVIPDTIIYGDNVDPFTQTFGWVTGGADLNTDGTPDLIVESGYTDQHEVNVFWGSQSFPDQRTRWRDHKDDQGWWYANGVPLDFADVRRSGHADMLVLTYVSHDTVWGSVSSGTRSFGYRDEAPFDTNASFRWRFLQRPSKVCIPGIMEMGAPVVNLGDINGDGEDDFAVGSQNSFAGDGAVVIFLGGKVFDTLPDAYYWPEYVSTVPVNAGQTVGGFDFNNDGLMDFAVPLPAAPTPPGNGEHPYGEVVFVAGSRALRPIALGVHEAALPRLSALSVYPHPAKDVLHVVLGEQASGRIDELTLVDMLGRTVRSFRTLGAGISFQLDGLPAGMYRVVVRSGTLVVSKTIIHIQ